MQFQLVHFNLSLLVLILNTGCPKQLYHVGLLECNMTQFILGHSVYLIDK